MIPRRSSPSLRIFVSGWFEKDGPAPMHVLRGSVNLVGALLVGVGVWSVPDERLAAVAGLSALAWRWILASLALLLIPAVASDYARAIKRLWSVPS